MVYSKEYYQKNKDRIRKHNLKWREANRDKENTAKRKWRHGVGKKLEQISKQKSDKKYYAKRKDDPDFKLKKSLYAKEYNSRPEVKEHTKITRTKYYANPKVKIPPTGF